MSREYGRKDHETREVEIAYERLDRVDGSARFGFGQTQSLVSISGPIEARLTLESPSQATLDIHIRPLATVPGTDAKALSVILKSVFTPSLLLSHHPRTLVQIVGQALGGCETGSGLGSVGRGWSASLVATLINATSAALVSASSIPMKGVVCAVAVGKLSHHGTGVTTLVVDPSESELASLSASGCFAFLFTSTLPTGGSNSSHQDVPNFSLIWTNYAASTSSFDEAELADSKRLAEEGAVLVWRRLKESVAHLESRSSTLVRVKQEPKIRLKREMSDADDEKMEI